MNKEKARNVLILELAKYGQMSYEELCQLMKEPVIVHVEQPGSPWYQIEIQVFHDDPKSGNIRVLGSIDDGGWRSIIPLSEDFIMAPDGSFVGE